MRLPIAGLQISVVAVEGLGSENPDDYMFGDASVADMRIRINADLLQDTDRLTETLIHECIHIVADMYEVKLTEEQVGVLGLGMHQMLGQFIMSTAIKALLEK